jgi:hypothetical protein
MNRELSNNKMQFNVKSAKNFRDTLAKWHNADFELSVALDKKSKNVANYKSMITTNNEILADIENGKSTIKTREELLSEIADFERRIKAESDTIKELRDVQKSRLESAYALLSKDLHKTYCNYISSGDNSNYVEELCKFFENNGVEPTMSVYDFVCAIGVRKATTKQKIANEKHTTSMAYTQWRDLFLGFLCDTMGNEVLPIDKFIYKTMEERRQAWEEKNKKTN